MANYESLKSAIRQVIKPNGNEEITGQVLQDTLISLVSSVGQNATFAGVAVPTTNPQNPDGNVFYLATQNGTYSNFGGIVIADEVAILSNASGSWVKISTGIANANITNELTSNLKFIETLDGYYINNQGIDTALANYAINKYEIVGNPKSVYLNLKVGGGGYMQVLDANNNQIRVIRENTSADTAIISERFDMPDNAKYVRITYLVSDPVIAVARPYAIADYVVENTKKIDGVKTDFIKYLKGKKIGIVGDSIAQGASSTSAANRFINILANMLECSSVKNVAVGGRTYAGSDGFWSQVANLNGDESLIVISGGVNDFNHSNEIGDLYKEVVIDGKTYRVSTSDEYAQNFCGGFHKLIETLYAKFGGYIPIVVSMPIQYKQTKNNVNKYLVDYCDTLTRLCEFYSIPCFNGYRQLGMNPNNATISSNYFSDGLHPNNYGHKIIAQSLYRFIINLDLPTL